MKILWLGSSQSVDGYLPEEQRAPGLVGKRLSELLQTDVEVSVRYIWPNDRLPSLLETWIDEYRPDMVNFGVAAYWCCYESVPLKIQRRFGRVGSPAANAGSKVADTGWLSSNRLYYAAKSLALATIGGETNFEPEEVVDRTKECIKIILDREGTALLLMSMHGLDPHYTLGRRRPWAEARRQFVDRELLAFCSDLPVLYQGLDQEADYYYDASLRLGDRMHLTPAGQVASVRDVVPRLLEAWTQRHPEVEVADTQDASPLAHGAAPLD